MFMTLASSLINQARLRADQANSQFVTDAEALGYLSLGYQNFYDLVTQSNNIYYVSQFDITLIPNQQDYPLPDTFYKLLGMDLINAIGAPVTLRPFQWNERNRYKYAGLTTMAGPVYRYNLLGSSVRFTPMPGSGVVKVYFTPRAVLPTLLTSDIDTMGFDEYLILSVALKMLAKEESDTTLIQGELQRQTERVQTMLADQDSSFPKVVVDVDTLNDNLYLPTFLR
jgi:hypothetical protein